jgi:hypothetical protein
LRSVGPITAALVGVAWLSGSASALVLADKSDPQKLRKDLQKQQSKYVKCLVKAALKCEKSGDKIVPLECDITDATTPPADDRPSSPKPSPSGDKLDHTKSPSVTLPATRRDRLSGRLGPQRWRRSALPQPRLPGGASASSG